MKTINLTNEKQVKVDDEDYAYLSKFVWSENTGGYASRKHNKTEEEAALAYNEAALKYHGEFARLNDV